MKEILPNLPYDYNALEPVISAEIMQIHHQKHHNAYVTNLNAALEKAAAAEAEGNLDELIALQPAIRFNGGGHINHSLFWENLAPEGKTKLKGDLAKEINSKWGSYESFVECFNGQVAPLQGSGWGWLAMCSKSKILCILTTSNQDSLKATMKGFIPLLGVDVWEHAYYLQYKNARPDYLKNIWRVVNWDTVSKRFEEGRSAKSCCKGL